MNEIDGPMAGTRLEELESLPILEMVKQRELDLMSYGSSCYDPALRMYGRIAGEIERLTEALRSIASNTCCWPCQEAALVAKAAIAKQGESDE